MNIWILNHYANSTFFDEGGRHFYIAKQLRNNGHKPVVFCANAMHGTGKCYFSNDQLWSLHQQNQIDVPYVFVKTRPYIGNGKKRILCMLDFYFNLKRTIKKYIQEKPRPDVIIASSVHPLTLFAGIKIAKSLKIKCICEIRDLWPESFVAYDILNERSLMLKLLRCFEKQIYKKADAIVFTMEGGYNYIKERGWQKDIPSSKIYYINNGIDLDKYNYDVINNVFCDLDLDNSSYFNVVYTGSIRKVNNVGKILDVAKCVTNKQIRFLIWGDGDELNELKARITNENIDNVIFKGRVEKKFVPSITSKADLNFAHNGQSDIFRFGISFNKMFDYLAAGKPILCDFSSKYNPAIQYGAGIAVESGNVNEIAECIDNLSCADKGYLMELSMAAKRTSLRYDFKVLTSEFERIICELDKI